ncbi:MAG: fatty acid CoA ligase family protein [Planctomycetia bacterium]|jgi:acyl-CoA synthetase (AMP-forming)/AMP-acid ligase II
METNEKATPSGDLINVASRLTEMARRQPDAWAVIEPLDYGPDGRRRYRQVSFRELDEDSDRIAYALTRQGIPRGTRLALLVRQGVDFISLVFGLLKAGMVSILIDPGMGMKKMLRCLEEAEPEGFVAISQAQAVRTMLRRRFPKAKHNVTVGRRWFWGGMTLAQIRRMPHPGTQCADTRASDPAAIIFTSGSTGPAKGVHFCHENFDRQVVEIRDFYDIQPGEIDVPAFPLFGLFNSAMGVTSVIPDMDPSRPASVDPAKILEAADDWQATQTFGSPAVWNKVGRYCEEHGLKLKTVRRVLSSGAPLPAEVLQRMVKCIHPDGDMYTPYGATESLPVASIAASEVLAETAAKTAQGAGVCVGRRFGGIAWKVIRVVDGPIEMLADAEELPPGQIGELIVQGPQVTRAYLKRPEANARSKIQQGDGTDRFWHRIGDTGYLDEEDRFWFCGRVTHRVLTDTGPMYTIPCEAIFNNHPHVFRCALVGVGRAGEQKPVVVVETYPDHFPHTKQDQEKFARELLELGQANAKTQTIETFLFHESLPVDIRHNAKIFREKLAVWTTERLSSY